MISHSHASPDDAGRPDPDGPGGGSEPELLAAVPADFLPVPDPPPPGIDIKTVCKEATRFVALHVLSMFNAVAINDGQRVFTTNDRGGEFRRYFGRLVGPTGTRRRSKDAPQVQGRAAGRPE